MRYMLIDIAQTGGGAKVILEQYYSSAIKDNENEWIFVTSNIALKSAPNITTLRYPKAAKSILHRLYYDYVGLGRIAKKRNVDKIISLQNTDISCKGIPQTVYLQNSIPFSDIKFKFKDDLRLWFYQNIYVYRIKRMLSNAQAIIVQTKWMKDACIKLNQKARKKIEVIAPACSEIYTGIYKKDDSLIYFYPANAHYHKNHRVIYEAIEIIASYNKELLEKFGVVLTIGQPSGGAPFDNISYIGTIDKDTMCEYYSKSILLFPSYIESFGLPLKEARNAGCPIVAAETPFSKEILAGYHDVVYFNYNNAAELANLIINEVEERAKTNKNSMKNTGNESRAGGVNAD